MKTELFDFALPEERIALRPAVPRDSARLLVIRADGSREHRILRDLPALLESGDLLTVNDSKVIPARLKAIRPARTAETSPVAVEITLLQRDGDTVYRAFVQPARRLRTGDRLAFDGSLSAEVLSRAGPEVRLAFDRPGVALEAAIAAIGHMPLPPYIARLRPPDEDDRSDYQTVYACHPGSVAAPTAGLHFTHELLQRLTAKGIYMMRTTLHVGPGTFLPVKGEDTADHHMYAETASVTAEAAERLNAGRAAGGRLVAVGTTALRTLESATGPDGIIRPFQGETDIFITPGYRFRAVDVLLTNFHLPRSTLFMLVSAFMGLETMQAAYAEAIRERYRFYSYGDACLLFRPA